MLAKKLLLALGASSILITACGGGGGGGSSSGGSNLPAVVSIPGPGAGFTFTSDAPVAFNADFSDLALPIGDSYQTVAISPSNASILKNANQVAVYFNGSYAVALAINNAGPNTLVVIAPSSSAAAAENGRTYTLPANLSVTAINIEFDSSGTLYLAGTINGEAQIITFPARTGTKTSSNMNVMNDTVPESSVNIPLSECPTTDQLPLGNPSTIKTATNNNITYVGVGTTTGAVCVFNKSGNQLINPTNLATQAPYKRYTPTLITAFGLAFQGNNLFGYWLTNNNSNNNGNLYRITALNSTTPSNIVATSFWQLNLTGPQFNDAKTVSTTFSNAPSNITSSVTDQNNNVYVGTTNGWVFKLANGSNTWYGVNLGGSTSPASVAQTSSGSGAIATTLINNELTTFIVN